MKIRSWQWVIGRKPERSVLGPPGYSPLTGAVVVDMAMLPMSALPPKADLIRPSAGCPLMTQSGHCLILGLRPFEVHRGVTARLSAFPVGSAPGSPPRLDQRLILPFAKHPTVLPSSSSERDHPGNLGSRKWALDQLRGARLCIRFTILPDRTRQRRPHSFPESHWRRQAPSTTWSKWS